MITGFNTDVEYDGRVFHVQTEDKGRENPIVETLVYSGGEIMDSILSSYDTVIAEGNYSETEVLKRMESQHKGVIREITNGKYDPDGPKPFGYKIITNRSLDAVVLDYLTNELSVGQIRLEMEEREAFVEGETVSIRLHVLDESTERPVAGSRVVIKLLSTKAKPRELFAGNSDDEGRVDAEFEIPESPKAETAILCQAEAAGTNSEIKRLVQKKGARPAGDAAAEQAAAGEKTPQPHATGDTAGELQPVAAAATDSGPRPEATAEAGSGEPESALASAADPLDAPPRSDAGRPLPPEADATPEAAEAASPEADAESAGNGEAQEPDPEPGPQRAAAPPSRAPGNPAESDKSTA